MSYVFNPFSGNLDAVRSGLASVSQLTQINGSNLSGKDEQMENGTYNLGKTPFFVFRDGVLLKQSVHYTVSSGVITFIVPIYDDQLIAMVV